MTHLDAQALNEPRILLEGDLSPIPQTFAEGLAAQIEALTRLANIRA